MEFKSAHPTNGKENLALLWPRYRLGLDADNTARGGTTCHFGLAFATRSGVPADTDKAEVEVPTDDGATWRPATVKTARVR
ncbi:hypothetical protein ACFCX0_46270 [Streptomyces sp. NPDC056352]|uniref:hypothetical protein n=1 Tax=Streptomyces sp. NPDC056352 TaxID=3345791 RepID=UPI0035DFA778